VNLDDVETIGIDVYSQGVPIETYESHDPHKGTNNFFISNGAIKNSPEVEIVPFLRATDGSYVDFQDQPITLDMRTTIESAGSIVVDDIRVTNRTAELDINYISNVGPFTTVEYQFNGGK